MLLINITHWLENHMMPCFYQKYLGIPCPGCGMQRSLIELFRGDLIESLRLYPALIPIIAMMGYLLLHLVFRFQKGGIILLRAFIFNATIIFFSYLYKMILFYI
jgi:hypothetical protein